jgi:hypothetical protein
MHTEALRRCINVFFNCTQIIHCKTTLYHLEKSTNYFLCSTNRSLKSQLQHKKHLEYRFLPGYYITVQLMQHKKVLVYFFWIKLAISTV